MRILEISPESKDELGRQLDPSFPRKFTLRDIDGRPVECYSIMSALLAHTTPELELQKRFANTTPQKFLQIFSYYLKKWQNSQRLHWAREKMQRESEAWDDRVKEIFCQAFDQDETLRTALRDTVGCAYHSTNRPRNPRDTLLTCRELESMLYYLRELATA